MSADFSIHRFAMSGFAYGHRSPSLARRSEALAAALGIPQQRAEALVSRGILVDASPALLARIREQLSLTGFNSNAACFAELLATVKRETEREQP